MSYQKTGWWWKLHTDSDHKQPGREWYILPFLAFTPWNKRTLASVPGFSDVYACSLEFGWLWWRYRFTIGHTTRLDQISSPPQNLPRNDVL